MQDNSWSIVGADGRHRLLSSQQDSCATANSTPGNLSFDALPTPALAAIFHHLDSLDSFRLAQTCQACAKGFAYQKAEFMTKVWEELLPNVTHEPPRRPSWRFATWGGTRGVCLPNTPSNPVSLLVKWEKNPGSSLRRLYAISHKPDSASLMTELWRRAWPRAIWSDLLRDAMSDTSRPPLIAPNRVRRKPLYIHVKVQIASDEPLQLPWNWLSLNLLTAPRDGLGNYFDNVTPQHLEPEMQEHFEGIRMPHNFHELWSSARIDMSLLRPAQADQFQHVMSDSEFVCFDTMSDFEDGYNDSEYESDLYYSETYYWQPDNMRKVAITGPWCWELPNAQEDLQWSVNGCVAGDDIVVALTNLSDPFELYIECHCKPFTYEVDDQPGWNLKRHQARQLESIKKEWRLKRRHAKRQASIKRGQVNSARRKDQAGMSRSSKASLRYQDTD